jgi:hypothetical protein
VTQAALPFAARRDRSLDLAAALEPTPTVRFRQGRDFTFSFSPDAGVQAGKWSQLYGPTPRQAVERLVELLARPARDLEAVPYGADACEVFVDSPVASVPRRLLAHVEGMGAAELTDLLQHMERWAC